MLKGHKLKHLLKLNNKGMTMAEVLIGFVVLSILLGGLSGIISTSNKMFMNSMDMKKAQEDFSKHLCKDNSATEVSGVTFEVQVTKTDNYFMKDNRAVLSNATLYLTSKDYEDASGETYTLRAYSIDYKE